MSTFKLNGVDVPFEPGDTIMRAAWRAGIEVPHYCWHPGLSVAANCRMCLVHITSGRQIQMPVLRWDPEVDDYVQDTKPKLQPACQMPVQEGMEVSSVNEEVQEAQSAVQEFLLLNHPVDCPICDQAGECKLQDYWLDHQYKLKRKRTEPVHKPKGVRFGPTIVYDAERCIMCTRCIRVSDEVAGDHVLDMRQRGNQNEIVLAPGRELDHRYTLMTEHVCPVGALTSRDFRFKARVWFLRSAPGVCTGCATGCNTHVDFDPRDNRVYRLRPRDNPEVNQFWMCDDGMMTYKEVTEGRVTTALQGRGIERRELALDAGLARVKREFNGVDPARVALVLSAEYSTEDNFAFARFAEVLGTERLYLATRDGWEGDDVLRDADHNPNRAGAGLVVSGGLKSADELVNDVLNGEVQAVLALGATGMGEGLDALDRLQSVVVLTSHDGPLVEQASLVLPVTCWAEMQGTFVNRQGLVQPFKAAVKPPAGIHPAWRTLRDVAVALGKELPFTELTDIRNRLRRETDPSPPPSAGAAATGA